jgi:hypothetical protein
VAPPVDGRAVVRSLPRTVSIVRAVVRVRSMPSRCVAPTVTTTGLHRSHVPKGPLMDDASTSTHRTATPVPRRATRARAALVLAGAALAPAVALGTASPSQAATPMITVPGGTGPVHYAVVTVSGTTTRALQLDGTRCVTVRAGDAVTYKYRGGLDAMSLRSFGQVTCDDRAVIGASYVVPTSNAHFEATDDDIRPVYRG